VNEGGHNFGPPQVLCSGSEDEDCDDGVPDLDEPGNGGADQLAEGEEVTIFKRQSRAAARAARRFAV
jgi:hypothetical protein